MNKLSAISKAKTRHHLVLELLQDLILVTAAAWFSGCSLYGFAFGAAADCRCHSYQAVSSDSLSTLHSGDQLRVLLPGRVSSNVVLERYEPETMTLVGYDKKDTYNIALDKRARVQKRVPRTHAGHAKWLGLGVGLLMDAGFMIAMAASWD